MIRKQIFQEYEIVNVDSGSTDGTYEMIKDYKPDISYQIKPEEYIPGKVLNEAIARCRGDIIVFNNSDCIPQDNQWLGNLIHPLLGNDKVAATFGCQVHRPDAHPLVVKDYQRAFGTGEISRQWFHFFSLATSAVPKFLLVQYPFDPSLQYSEDIDWSFRIKQKGYLIVYVPEAVVEHSHNYTMRDIKKRYYGEGYAEGHIYRDMNRPGSAWGTILKPALAEIIRDSIYLFKSRNLQYLGDSLRFRFYQRYSVYRGIMDYQKSFKRDRKY